MLNNQKGFILISVILIMLLMAATVFSINYYSATQLRMASNQSFSVRTSYDLKAIVEQSDWKLTDNLFWRTVEAGEDYTFNGTTYTRIVRNADTAPFNYPSDYSDAVTIQVTSKGATQSFQRSFRYYVKEISGLSLNNPSRISMDSSGNLLIADTGNHRVLKVNPDTSAVTIIAGTGSKGYDGDGSFTPSFLPRLDNPQSICENVSGPSSDNISYYIADSGNDRIREINLTTNIITTVAGGGSAGCSDSPGNATDAEFISPEDIFNDQLGNLYISDANQNRVCKVNLATNQIETVVGSCGVWGSGGDGGAATNATLGTPTGIFKDSSGNLYIADEPNSNIRKVNTFGIISTVVSAGISGPADIVVDGSGNIFIASLWISEIKVVNVDNGNIYALTGGYGDIVDVPAVDSLLNDPSGIAMASSYGNRKIFITDGGNDKIKFLLFKTVYGL